MKKGERRKMVHSLNRVSPANEVWMDRWTAMRIGFGLIYMAICRPYLRFKNTKTQ